MKPAMFRSILDCDLLRDGGSLVLRVERDDGEIENFRLDRSIHARGTGAFGRVTSNRRGLSGPEARDVAAALARIPAAADHPVIEFVEALTRPEDA